MAIERTAWAVEAPRKPTKAKPGRWRVVSLWWTRAAAREHCDYEAGQRVRIRRHKVEVYK